MGTSYRERSSVHEGRYGCPVTKKPLTGKKTGGTGGCTQTQSRKILEEKKDVVRSVRLEWPSPSLSWPYFAGHIVVGLHRLLWEFRF